ncbi:S-layer homology domain-containing protein [Lysinibacillus sp. FSL K6-0057]|uniref:S-layer homology domain-containing protein n=1 Tax=Lysinibacillus sp. FSL K6-0057 TaxID=2921411 RepID=UPI00315A535C
MTVQGNSGHLEKAGYTFVGWNTKADGTGTVYKANETFPIGKVHVILYAQWIVNPPSSGDNTTSPNDNDYSSLSTVKITFHTNGGTILPPQEIAYNTKIRDLPLPTKDGFRFDGWYEDAAFKIEWDEDTVIRENIVIYAKWIPLLVDESDTPLPKEMVRFYDMDSHWAKEIVEELAILKIIQGYEDGTFRPNEPISRMHVAVLFARAFEFESIRSAKAFSDIATNHVYYEEINTLQQAGIIDGMGDTFRPVEAITRAQVAKILAKTLRLPSEGTSSFSDVSSNHWSTGYIAALEQAGIAFGSNGEFHPDVPVTRAELATFLYRALQF